jgi:hypothetical protein
LKLHGQKEPDDLNDYENICPNEKINTTFAPSKDLFLNCDEDTLSSRSDLSGTPARPRPKKRTFSAPTSPHPTYTRKNTPIDLTNYLFSFSLLDGQAKRRTKLLYELV